MSQDSYQTPSIVRRGLSRRSISPMTAGSTVSSYPLMGNSSEPSSDEEHDVTSGENMVEKNSKQQAQVSLSFMGLFSVPMSPKGDHMNSIYNQPLDDSDALRLPRAETVNDLFKILQMQNYRHVVEDLEETGEVVDDAMLMRWMDAHGTYKRKKGHHTSRPNVLRLLIDHARWRCAFVGKSVKVMNNSSSKGYGISEDSIQDMLNANILFLQGNDEKGHPVLIFLAKRYDAQAFSKRLSRCLVYAMDGALSCADGQTNPKKQIIWVFDLDFVNRKNVSVEFLESMFSLFQGHYPECLHKLYFLNAPFLFWALWRCASAFVAPETREKIEFVSIRGSYNSPSLVSKIGTSILPDVYGGSAPWRPVQESVGILRCGGKLCHQPHIVSQDASRKWYTSSPVSIPSFSCRSIIFWILFMAGAILWVVLKMLAL